MSSWIQSCALCFQEKNYFHIKDPSNGFVTTIQISYLFLDPSREK